MAFPTDFDTASVLTLLEKAAKTERGDEAMRFTQAALNAAQALNTLKIMASTKYPS